jgi:hypothetical protein
MKAKINDNSLNVTGEYGYYGLESCGVRNKVLCSIRVEEASDGTKIRYIPEYMDKKVLYIFNFETEYWNRNKGYATFLLKDIIKRFKGKYDLMCLNACPYHFEYGEVVYEPPVNGLGMDRLVEFYKSFGFEVYGATKEGFKTMILERK